MDLTFSASLGLARENSEERDDECENQERHHVLVRLTAPRRRQVIRIEKLRGDILRVYQNLRRLRVHLIRRIRTVGQINARRHAVIVNRYLVRDQSNAFDAVLLPELVVLRDPRSLPGMHRAASLQVRKIKGLLSVT